MSCCGTEAQAGTDRFFSRNARHYHRRFLRRGLGQVQRALIEGIAAAAPVGCSVLEIGCGVGALHLTLLQRGASRATGVDISEGMIEHARQLAGELGLLSRTAHFAGDFVALAPGLPPSDIVVLDKVVCCYDDLPALLDASLGRTGRVYALSYPRGAMRWGFAVLTALGLLLRWSFIPRWHDWEQMLLRIRRDCGAERYASDSLFWSVRVFERR